MLIPYTEPDIFSSPSDPPSVDPIDRQMQTSISSLVPVPRVNDFAITPSVDRKVFDSWYEKFLLTITKPESILAAPQLEAFAGAIKAVPDMVGNFMAAGLMAAGDIYNPQEDVFDYSVALEPAGVEPLGISAAKGLSSLQQLAQKVYIQSQELTGTEFFKNEAKTNRERISQMTSALGFHLYANAKHFDQRLREQIDYPLAYDVGNVGGQVALSALLGSVNPTLALGVLTGNVTAIKYLENRAAGVPWAPSAVMAGVVGGAQGSVERLTLSVLYRRYASKLGFIGDIILANAAEEGIQEGIDIGAEVFVGRREFDLVEDTKQTLYNTFLGALGGGMSAPVVFAAHGRIVKNLEKAGVSSEIRDSLATKLLGLGYEVGHEMIKETTGVSQEYLDDFKAISEGAKDPKEFAQRLMEEAEQKIALIIPEQKPAVEGEKKPLVVDEAEIQKAVDEQIAHDLFEPAAEPLEPVRPDILATAKLLMKGWQAKLEEEESAVEEELSAETEGQVPSTAEETLKLNVESVGAIFKSLTSQKDSLYEDEPTLYFDIASPDGRPWTFTIRPSEATPEGIINKVKQSNPKAAETLKMPKQSKAAKLTAKLEDIRSQLENIANATLEELKKQKIIVRGSEVERIRQLAEETGRKDEAKKLKAKFKQKTADLTAMKKDAEKYLRKSLPPALRGKFTGRLNEIKTEKTFSSFIDAVSAEREVYYQKYYETKVEEALEKMVPRSERNIQKGRYGVVQLQDVANKIVSIAQMSKAEVQQQLYINTQKVNDMLLNAYSFSGKGEAQEVVDKWTNEEREVLDFETFLLSTFGAVAERTSKELKTALSELGKIQNLLRMTSQQVILARQVEKEAVKQATIAEIKGDKNVEKLRQTNLGKVVHYFKRMESGLITAPASDIGTLLNILSNIKGKDVPRRLKQLAVSYLEASRVEASFTTFLVDAYNTAMKTAYNITTEKERQDLTRQRNSFKTEDGAYINENAVNTFGEPVKGGYIWSKGTLLRYYALTHNIDGTVNAEKWEYLTGENERSAIEDDIENETLEEGSPEHAKRLKDIAGNKINPEDLERGWAQLTKDDLRYVSIIKQIYASQYPLWNSMYRKVMLTDLPMVAGEYYPEFKEVAGKEIDTVLDDLAFRFSVSVPGSFRERNPMARAPFKQLSIDDDLSTTALEMSHFMAYYSLIKDTYSLLKDPDIREAINQVTDGRALKNGKWADGNYYKQLVNRVEMIASRGRLHLQLSRAMTKYNQNLSSMFTGGQIDIGVGQVIQSLAALEYITPQELIAGILDFKNNPEAVLKLVMKSPIKQTRAQNFLLEIRDIIQSGKAGNLDILGTGGDYKTFFFLPITLGDNVSTTLGGYAVLRAIYKRTGDINLAYDKMDEYIEKTQQSARLTQLGRTQQGNWRVLFKFISYPLTATRRVINTVHEAQTGQVPWSKAGFVVFLYWGLLSALWDASKKLWEWELRDAMSAMMIGQIQAIPLLGNMIQNMIISGFNHLDAEGEKDRRYPISFVFTQPFDKVAQAFDSLLTGIEETNWERMFDGVIDMIAYPAGVKTGLPLQTKEAAKVLFRIGEQELPAEAVLHPLFGRTLGQTEKFFKEQ
jgi:hypothetical protein